MMSSSTEKMPPIQGLSRREQSKLERLIQAEKTEKHAKSYKRKPSKGKHPEEPSLRKLIKTQTVSNHDRSNEESSSAFHDSKSKPVVPTKPSSDAVHKKERTHLNPHFPLEGDETSVVDYLLMYSFTQKGKKMEQGEQDLSFLQELAGTPLPPIFKPDLQEAQRKLNSKLDEYRKKIDVPFDQYHLEFSKKFCTPEYLNN